MLSRAKSWPGTVPIKLGKLDRREIYLAKYSVCHLRYNPCFRLECIDGACCQVPTGMPDILSTGPACASLPPTHDTGGNDDGNDADGKEDMTMRRKK